MNRYVAEGLIADAALGKRIVVVSRSRVTFWRAVRGHVANVEQFTRVTGDRFVTKSGGVIEFVQPGPQRLQGRRIDVLVLHRDEHSSWLQEMSDVIRFLVSQGTEVINL